MKVYIVQIMSFPFSNPVYVNHKSFSSLKKAVSYCVRILKMKPSNYSNNEQFSKEEYQLFNSVTPNKSTKARIMTMEVIQ